MSEKICYCPSCGCSSYMWRDGPPKTNGWYWIKLIIEDSEKKVIIKYIESIVRVNKNSVTYMHFDFPINIENNRILAHAPISEPEE